ncbi:MAG: helix-turn-helix domain-containing protein, partial [Cohnella sp.]|nr:helix-turn-helix domain-containing protein [Cohnella sp.]
LKPVYLDQWFSNLIAEPSEHQAIQATLEHHFAVAGPIKEAVVGIVSLELAPPSIQSKFSSCWDLLYYSLANICNEFLRAKNAGYAFRYRGQDQEIAIVMWDRLDDAEELLREINEGIYKALKARFGIGIGEKAAFPSKLDGSYRSARKSIRQRNLLRMDTAVQAVSPLRSEGGNAKSGIFFTEHEQRIRYALLSGDKDQLANAYAAWFKSIEQADVITLEQLHLWWQEFRLARRIWTSESPNANADRHDSDEIRMPPFLDENLGFDSTLWLQGFLSESEKIMEGLSANPDRSRSTMQAIADYVEQYIHEELSLQDISNRFYLSREYISRKFKQEMNENLTDYITRVRVERAKRLLADTPLKISIIAERVGFQDEKYFSKVFKKWTDHSPNEYRKLAFGDNRGK